MYPNDRHFEVDQRVQFFHYDPEVKGWYVYGLGTANAAQVGPDARTRLYERTGAMINGDDGPGSGGPTPGTTPKADPIDPSTGIFTLHKTDLSLPDVIPLALTRTYNSADGLMRSFGRSMTHPYAMFLWSASQYQEADLILPEGGRIHFVRTSPGNGVTDAVFVHHETQTTSATLTAFCKAYMTWNSNGWDVRLTDGTLYVFGENAPLQAIRDRYGNTVTIAHASGQAGRVTQVTSPNGRWIKFTYDPSNRISQVTDNIDRTVSYTYDANGNLSTVTDPETTVTTYTYDASNQLATIKDGRNIVSLTNVYTNGRVTQQTLADPTDVYTLAYTTDANNHITQTEITDPREHVERLTFNSDHYVVSDTEAYGTSVARTTTTERQPGSNLVEAVIDGLVVNGLNRRTAYTYDSAGRVETVTRLAGTPDAVTTTFTYEPQFSQLATMEDPLGHTWTFTYDAAGRLTGVTDPLTHQTTMVMNGAGQVTSVTDPLQHTWQWAFSGGDLVSTTSPLNEIARRFVDGAGRLVSTTDPLGRTTRLTVDKLNRVLAVLDPIGAQTQFAYDPNNQVLSLTDALSHTTSYTYDDSDRVATRTDPFQNVATYVYDGNDNLTQLTDRKGQVTDYEYDALDRLSKITDADTSTVEYTYDAGDRLLQIVASVAGTITRTYDGLNRLTSEMTPEGNVTYTYDADCRRTTMTLAGQPPVIYDYDDAHRLTSITQGTSVVAFTYDDADRRATLTLPNGIVTTYGYDDAGQLTSLTYTIGQATLGDVTYTYDAAGNRTSMGGTWARTGLPQAVMSASYDAGNRLVNWNAQAFSYDANGNLASDGPTSYLWNARNRLAGLSGGTTASFAYDGLGRRRSKTVNGATTQFVYDKLNLVQELAADGTPLTKLPMALGIDEIFTRIDATGLTALLVDGLGSTLALAQASGDVQTRYTFEPFGATTTSGVASTNSVQFTGRENDTTGLFYYRARYYSPGTGLFIAEDPFYQTNVLPPSETLYSYVRNDPIGFRNPLGLLRDCAQEQIDCFRKVSVRPDRA